MKNSATLMFKDFCEQVVLLQRAPEVDFTKWILEKNGTPDYNRCNMRKATDTDQSKMPKVKSSFASILD